MQLSAGFGDTINSLKRFDDNLFTKLSLFIKSLFTKSLFTKIKKSSPQVREWLRNLNNLVLDDGFSG